MSYADMSHSEADYEHIAETELNNTNSFHTVNMSRESANEGPQYTSFNNLSTENVSAEVGSSSQQQHKTGVFKKARSGKKVNNNPGGGAGGDSNSSSYIEELMLMKRVDGMTFCLVMLDKCYQELQRECVVMPSLFPMYVFVNSLSICVLRSVDAEYSARMTQRNKATVALIDDMLQYKQSLLSRIADMPDVLVREKCSTNLC